MLSDRDAVMITLVLVLIVLAAAVWIVTTKVACDQLQTMTGRVTTYLFPSGCYVDVEGSWIPAKWFRWAYRQ